ncbi:MAG: STAS domain-containing protein [Oscillospiraceae bacterium]|nr:STAS domain-containing protein [Oscillospiraceae bacterium]
MAVKVINHGEKIIAELSGDIDHHNLKEIRSEIDHRLEESTPKWLILDFEDVDFMDSSGIGLILGRKRVLDLFGGGLAIRNAKAGVRKIIRLAGLEHLIMGTESANLLRKGTSEHEN